ncbi:MAG: hypothetical protein RLZZ76_93 [Candidatus Parcubacteria bacterium]|jgi:hypothetical protein
MKQSTILIFVALSLVVGFSFLLFVSTLRAPEVPLLPENEVPVEESQTETITYTNASADLVTVELPLPGAMTGKEFGVIGSARGYWFFEGSFPIEILDKDGNVLTTGIGTALGEWMTEDFVKFVSEVKVPETYIGPATVVLKKDNPSGLPENDASVSFPITIEY